MLSFKQFLNEELPKRLVEFAKDKRFWFNTKTKKLVKVTETYHDWEPVKSPEKFGLKRTQVEKFEPDVERGKDVIPGIAKLMRVGGWTRILVENGPNWSIQTDTLPQAHDVVKILIKKHESPIRIFLDYGRKSDVLQVGQIDIFIKTGKIVQQTAIGATMARFR